MNGWIMLVRRPGAQQSRGHSREQGRSIGHEYLLSHQEMISFYDSVFMGYKEGKEVAILSGI